MPNFGSNTCFMITDNKKRASKIDQKKIDTKNEYLKNLFMQIPFTCYKC